MGRLLKELEKSFRPLETVGKYQIALWFLEMPSFVWVISIKDLETGKYYGYQKADGRTFICEQDDNYTEELLIEIFNRAKTLIASGQDINNLTETLHYDAMDLIKKANMEKKDPRIALEKNFSIKEDIGEYQVKIWFFPGMWYWIMDLKNIKTGKNYSQRNDEGSIPLFKQKTNYTKKDLLEIFEYTKKLILRGDKPEKIAKSIFAYALGKSVKLGEAEFPYS